MGPGCHWGSALARPGGVKLYFAPTLAVRELQSGAQSGHRPRGAQTIHLRIEISRKNPMWRLADGANECIGIVNNKGEYFKFTKKQDAILASEGQDPRSSLIQSYSAIESVLQK
jgi:hypothetical protein